MLICVCLDVLWLLMPSLTQDCYAETITTRRISSPAARSAYEPFKENVRPKALTLAQQGTGLMPPQKMAMTDASHKAANELMKKTSRSKFGFGQRGSVNPRIQGAERYKSNFLSLRLTQHGKHFLSSLHTRLSCSVTSFFSPNCLYINYNIYLRLVVQLQESNCQGHLTTAMARGDHVTFPI